MTLRSGHYDSRVTELLELGLSESGAEIWQLSSDCAFCIAFVPFFIEDLVKKFAQQLKKIYCFFPPMIFCKVSLL